MKRIFSHRTKHIQPWITSSYTFHPAIIDSIPQIPVIEVLLITAPERLLGHGISIIGTHCSDCCLFYSARCTGERLLLHQTLKVTVQVCVPTLHTFQKQLCPHKIQDSGLAKQLVHQGVQLHV
jgi:hypothetical protein